MKALKYSVEKNAVKAIEAGCNLVLHCNGNIHEMKKYNWQKNHLPNQTGTTKAYNPQKNQDATKKKYKSWNN